MSVRKKQTTIPFAERKRVSRNKSSSSKKGQSSDENENSPLKITRSASKVSSRNSLAQLQCNAQSLNDLRRTPRSKRSICHKDDEFQTPTPPKRKFEKNSPTSDKPVVTPSSAFSKLTLNSEGTSKKEQKEKSSLKPKELFPSNARKAFHSSISESLPCRENELNELRKFLLDHLENETSGSIYISGLPGTGKTASINKVMKLEEVVRGYKICYINCTSIQSTSAVYRRICEELAIKMTGRSEKSSIEAVETYLLRKHKMILLILDEIDQLETKTQSILYKIFEWPAWKNAQLVLLGIANAMDLTDRILPRLCAKVELKPVLMHFAPYTKDQIAQILKHRLSEVGAGCLFAPNALELLAAKVASMSGDVRRALDLGRRVVEVSGEKAELWEQTLDTALKEDSIRRSPRKTATPLKSPQKPATPKISPRKLDFNDSPSKTPPSESLIRKSPRKLPFSPLKRPTESPVRKSPRKLNFVVESRDVMSVVSNLYGSARGLKCSESSFPLHQKLLICTLLLLLKKGKSKDISVGRLHQVYSKVCNKRGITALDHSAFLSAARQVEMTGALHLGKQSQGRLAKLRLQWDERDVTDALKDVYLLSSILDDVCCLS